MWVLALVALAVLLLQGPRADGYSAAVYERPKLGLAVEVPAGWTVVRTRLSECTDPVQRIALVRGDAVVQLVEQLGGDVRGFPERPARFKLRGSPESLGCCPPAVGEGCFIAFREHRRGFYAFVYAGGAERADVLRILDSLTVRPRVHGSVAR